ncbi:type II secretion system F family protein [Candidatus Dependentiae bacterium]
MFFYQAFSKDGKKLSGFVDAPSRQAVKERLARQGIFPVKIMPASKDSRQSWFQRLFERRVSVKDKILFTKQLSVLLKSGVPLLQALELLVDHFEGRLRTIVISLKDDIKEGGSFADGLKKFPKDFDNIYVQLIRAGEASGKLEVILDRLTEYAERRASISKRIRSAMTYPIIQLVGTVIVVIIMVVFVIPNMAENLSGMGKGLPASTQFLMDLSDFLTNYYHILLGLLLALIVGLRYWLSTPFGARTFDKMKLRLPVVKFFSRMGAVVQFSSTLGMLIESGVHLSESLDIVVKIINNRILADTLSEARDKIVKQGKIAQYLKQTNIFPPIAIYLIKTGEESGQLDTMLLTVAQNYEEELSEKADNLSTALGPIMLVIMAVVVGFVVISMITPMLEQASGF